MAYIKGNRKVTVHLHREIPWLLLNLQGVGNSEFIKNLMCNWIKIRNCGKAGFFGFICGPAPSHLKGLETSGMVMDMQVPPPTTLHSLALPSPFSFTLSFLQAHQGLCTSCSLCLHLFSPDISTAPYGLLDIFPESISQRGPPRPLQ